MKPNGYIGKVVVKVPQSRTLEYISTESRFEMLLAKILDLSRFCFTLLFLELNLT